MFVDWFYGERCVEYDGIPPAHCATMRIDEFNIYLIAWPYEQTGNCFKSQCGNGTPTTEECSDPWIAPWVPIPPAPTEYSIPSTTEVTHK